LNALAARYQWMQGTSHSMRVRGSTDPLRARLLLNILVPESPPGARRHQASSYIHARPTLCTFAKWHAVQLLVCGFDSVNVLSDGGRFEEEYSADRFRTRGLNYFSLTRSITTWLVLSTAGYHSCCKRNCPAALCEYAV